MRHPLYSELRTLYEATAQNPRTFRITIKLKDMVDEPVLVDAVRKTMERFPYFCVRLVVADDALYFEDNPAPMPVLHTDEAIELGAPETDYHLFVVSWWKNKVHLNVMHALTDGGGMYHMVQTFLYYYCSEYYGRELSSEGVWLAGESVDPAEWEDPARGEIVYDPRRTVEKWDSPAFQIADGGLVKLTESSIVYNIRIPEDQFMRFNMSKEGSPATIVALFLRRAIASLHPEAADPVAIALCVNQRRALGAPLAHQSLVGDARLVFKEAMKGMDFELQETCYRGMVAVQTNKDMVLKEVSEYKDLMEELEALPTHADRARRCKELADEKSRIFTATVSYVGKVDMGEAEFYVQEFHALPSTALPSCTTPLTLELSAVNGSFYVNFLQFFESDVYLRAFIQQLRDNDINYDVLYQERTRYPGFATPWPKR